MALHADLVEENRCNDTLGQLIQEEDLERAYPQRLKRLLIVDAPTIFFGLWRAVKPLLRESTVAKVHFLPYGEAAGRYEELFGHEVASRLLEEAVENRDPAAVKRKRWASYYGPALLPEGAGAHSKAR